MQECEETAGPRVIQSHLHVEGPLAPPLFLAGGGPCTTANWRSGALWGFWVQCAVSPPCTTTVAPAPSTITQSQQKYDCNDKNTRDSGWRTSSSSRYGYHRCAGFSTHASGCLHGNGTSICNQSLAGNREPCIYISRVRSVSFSVITIHTHNEVPSEPVFRLCHHLSKKLPSNQRTSLFVVPQDFHKTSPLSLRIRQLARAPSSWVFFFTRPWLPKGNKVFGQPMPLAHGAMVQSLHGGTKWLSRYCRLPLPCIDAVAVFGGIRTHTSYQTDTATVGAMFLVLDC